MLRLLKNTTSRLVFAGLALILAFSITFLPGVFALEDYIGIDYTYSLWETETLEDGTDISNFSIVAKTAGKYMSINGSGIPAPETAYPECYGYVSLVSIEAGSGIPVDANVTINNNTGEYSITSDTGMDLAVGDEVMIFHFAVSPDTPSDLYSLCYADYTANYVVEIAGVAETGSDSGSVGMFVSQKSYQDPTFQDLGPINKVYGDANFWNVAPTHTSHTQGEITYASGDESVATVDSATGEVHIVGAGSTTITATAARYYNLLETSTSYTLNVDPKEISIVDASVPDKTYDGTTDSEVGTVTLSEAGLVQGVDYTVSGVLNDANVGVDRTATVTVTLIGDAANNYVLTSNTFDKSGITISPYSITSDNIFLEYYVIGYDGTEKEPGVTVKIGNFTVDPNEYTVGYEDNVDVGTATVTVTAKDNANIASNAQKNFEIVDKNVLEITGISGPQTKTYTGLPVVLDGTLTVGPNTDGITIDDLTTTWYIYGAGGWIVTTQPTDVGIYKVVYSYDGPNYAGSLEVDFDIDRAVSPDPAELGGFEIEAGKRLSDIEGIRTLGFAWDDEDTIVERGRNTYLATYTYNNDPVNYTTLQLRIPVNGLYTPDPEPAPTPTPGGDDGTITVPDTGRFTNTNSGANNTVTFVGFALMGLALVVLVSGRFARNKIDFDKK